MRAFLAFVLALALAGPALAQTYTPGSRAQPHKPAEWIISTVYPAGSSTVWFDAPSGCVSLRLTGSVRGTTAATSVVGKLQFNGDTSTADYFNQRVYGNSGSALAANDLTAGYIYVGDIASATAPSGAPTTFRVDIADFHDNVFRKTTLGQYGLTTGGAAANFFSFLVASYWSSSAPIVNMQFTLASGAFAQGSRVTLTCVNY